MKGRWGLKKEKERRQQGKGDFGSKVLEELFWKENELQKKPLRQELFSSKAGSDLRNAVQSVESLYLEKNSFERDLMTRQSLEKLRKD